MNKIKYQTFCEENYVPVYSKPWWMDAICGEDKWDVWLYEKGGAVMAAMPYYMEKRGDYAYITKAPLTQNNGLIISYPDGQKLIKRQAFEEEIVNAAVNYIYSLNLDVYEQQFMPSFRNHLPYFWHGFEVIPRVTYVITDTSDLSKVESNVSSNYRKNIRKGRKSIARIASIGPEKFYQEHEKIFARQGLPCPFSFEFWMRLYQACQEHNAGEILTAQDDHGTILSLIFLVWDEMSMYLLLGGEVPEYASLQTYMALVWESIERASHAGLKFDFEGSVIKRINHAFRQFGGTPMQYFRIRKVFNPEIVRKEAEEKINAESMRVQNRTTSHPLGRGNP